jgi:hypothetical protein
VSIYSYFRYLSPRHSHLLRLLFFLQLTGRNLYIIVAVTVIAIVLIIIVLMIIMITIIVIVVVVVVVIVVRFSTLARPIFGSGRLMFPPLVLLLYALLPDPSSLHPILLDLAHEALQPAPKLPRVVLASGEPILGHVGVV